MGQGTIQNDAGTPYNRGPTKNPNEQHDIDLGALENALMHGVEQHAAIVSHALISAHSFLAHYRTLMLPTVVQRWESVAGARDALDESPQGISPRFVRALVMLIGSACYLGELRYFRVLQRSHMNARPILVP